MNRQRLLTTAFVVLSSCSAWADPIDCPRPDLWERYPQIKQEVDRGLAELKDCLGALEPEAFAARHPELARMARSADCAQRARALRAVAALEDPSGIPLLVAGIEDAVKDAKAEQQLNEAIWPLVMWIAGRGPRDQFKPLAPLFLDILVKTPDWPSVRCRCLQGLGNLADAHWLPIVRELLKSRHPAVTDMSAWVVQQLSSRPVSMARPEPGTAPARADTFCLALRVNETTCKPSEKELAAILADILKTIRCDVQPEADDDQVFYSNNAGWFDGWIPMSPFLGRSPHGQSFYTWRYRSGRVLCWTANSPDQQPRVEQRVWYNPLGAPICSVRYREDKDGEPLYFYWADYSADHLLRRVVEFNADHSLRFVNVFDNGPGYCWTVHRKFGADGKMQSALLYAEANPTCTDGAPDAPATAVYYGSRIQMMKAMGRLGLATFYPIPPAPAAAHAGRGHEQPGGTNLMLFRNGDRLTGMLLNRSISIRTSYAQIKLDSHAIADIALGSSNNADVIRTVNGDRLSGSVEDAAFVFKLQSGAQIEVRKEYVLKVVLRDREGKSDN